MFSLIYKIKSLKISYLYFFYPLLTTDPIVPFNLTIGSKHVESTKLLEVF